MTAPDTPPAGWHLESESTVDDRIVGREFTTLIYRSADADRTLRIRDVQEPNDFGGWGYLVWTTGVDGRELDLVETIDEAVEQAFDYMRSTEARPRDEGETVKPGGDGA